MDRHRAHFTPKNAAHVGRAGAARASPGGKQRSKLPHSTKQPAAFAEDAALKTALRLRSGPPRRSIQISDAGGTLALRITSYPGAAAEGAAAETAESPASAAAEAAIAKKEVPGLDPTLGGCLSRG